MTIQRPRDFEAEPSETEQGQLDVTFTDLSEDPEGYRLYARKSDGSYEQVDDDIDAVDGETVEYTTGDLLHGQLYGLTVEVFDGGETKRDHIDVFGDGVWGEGVLGDIPFEVSD